MTDYKSFYFGDRVQYLNSHKVKIGRFMSQFLLEGHEMATVQLHNGAFVTLPLERLSVLHEPVQCNAHILLWGSSCRCNKMEHDYRTVSHETTYTNVTVKWRTME